MSAGEVTYAAQPPPQMTYEQYLAEVIIVVQALILVLAAIAAPYQALGLVRRDWIGFLAQAYPHVQSARRQVSEISRHYYDSQRYQHTGPIVVPTFNLDEIATDTPFRDDALTLVEVAPRLDILLDHYEPSWFEEAMEPVREEFSKPAANDKALSKVLGRVQKEVENAGRNVIMRAVDSDQPSVVRGWARVEGNENIGSCGFCAMMISRGPVYTDSPEYAGLMTSSNTRAVRIFEKAQKTGDDSELMGLMNRWHPNCDCKVVPVFKGAETDWPGYQQYVAMEELWKEVIRDFNEEHGRSPRQGDASRGHEALNALRRRLAKGNLPASIRRPRAA